jgi:hypothetical protein
VINYLFFVDVHFTKRYSHATDSGTPCVLLQEGATIYKVPLTEKALDTYVHMYPTYIHNYVCTYPTYTPHHISVRLFLLRLIGRGLPTRLQRSSTVSPCLWLFHSARSSQSALVDIPAQRPLCGWGRLAAVDVSGEPRQHRGTFRYVGGRGRMPPPKYIILSIA